MRMVTVEKASRVTRSQKADSVVLDHASLVRVHVNPRDVASTERQGDDLILHLRNGHVVRIGHFYTVEQDGIQSDLVLDDDKGVAWLATNNAGANGAVQSDFTYAEASPDVLLGSAAAPGDSNEMGAFAWILGGVAGAAGIAAAVNGGGGGSDSGNSTQSSHGLQSLTGDSTDTNTGTGSAGTGGGARTTTGSSVPPAAPDGVAVSGDGKTVTGHGAAGDIVTVQAADGTVLGTGTVGTDGTFSVALSSAQTNGQHLEVSQADATGDASPQTEVTAPDATPPAAPVISDVLVGTADVADGGAVASSTPTLAGTAEAGSTVTVYDNGTELGTTTADASGIWVYTPPEPLADGDQVLTATATDAAGNTSPASAPYEVTVDTTAPAAPAAHVSDDGTTVTGTGEPGDTVTVYGPDGTTVLGTATVGTDGAYSVTLSSPQTNGQQLEVSQTDAAGNVSPQTDIAAPDSTAPAAPMISGVSDGGTEVASGGETNDATPTLTGTAEPDSTVTVYDNGTAIGTAPVDASGNWTYTPSAPLGDGSQSLTATATDAAGNVSPASAAYDITVDATAPAAPVINDVTAGAVNVANGGSTTDATPTLAGTAEAGSTVTISDNGTVLGTTTADASGNWSYTPSTALSDGTQSLTATATDAAGNVSPASAVYDLTVDTVAPAAPLISDVQAGTGATATDIANGGSTNDATPTLTGTAEAGATVTIYDNGSGTPLGTTTADGSGNWTFTPAAALPEGAQAFTATATDAAGNVSPASAAYDVTVDTSAPAAPVIGDVTAGAADVANGGLTNDATPTLTGTAEAGATVTIYDNGSGTPLGTTTADGSGNWTFTPATALPDGTQSLTATATDAAGNVSPASTAYDITVDATAPVAPAISDVQAGAGASVVDVANGGSTNDTTPTLTGTAEAGSTVTIYDNGSATPLGTTTADGSGNWTYVVTTALPEGGQAFTATATDAAGNVGPASTAYDITVDTTAPTAPVISDVQADGVDIANGDETTDTTPTLTGTAEAGSTVTIYDGSAVLGQVTADGSGNWSYTPAVALGAGTQVFTATATDAAGNVSPASAAYDVTVDTSAPDAPVIVEAQAGVGATAADIANGGLTDDATPTLTGTAEAGATVTIYDNGSGTPLGTTTADGSGNWTFTPGTALADGAQSFTATATDAADNTGPASAAYNLTVDTTAPVAPAISEVSVGAADVVNGGLTNDGTPTLTGTAEAGATVTIYDNGTEIGTTTADGSGNWTYTPTTALPDGAQSLTATATDAAGNVGPASTAYDITVDTTAPAAPVISDVQAGAGASLIDVANGGSTNDTTPTLTGTAEAGATVTIYDNGSATPLGTTTADGSGNWTFTPGTALPDGVQAFTATATDAAGNTGVASTAYDVTVDTSAPAAPAISDVQAGAGASAADIANGGLTNDSTPTLTGTAEAGATVTIYDNGSATPLGTTTADGSGNWTFTPGTALADGAQAFTATATDAAGNTSPASTAYDITVDTTAPVAPVSQVSNDGTTVTGTGEAGDTVTVYAPDGTTVLGTATVAGDGSYSVTLSAPQINGQELEVGQTDAAGNVSPLTEATAPVAAPTATVSADGTTVTGAGIAGDTVTVYAADGTTSLGSATVAGDGSYSVTLSAPQTNAQELEVVQANGAGVVSPDTEATAPDLTAPAAPVISDVQADVGGTTADVASGGITSDSTPTLTGTAEAGSTVTISDNGTVLGTTTAGTDGSWSYSPAALADGAQSFTATAADAAGNVSGASSAYNVTVVPAAPVIVDAQADTGGTTTDVANGGSTSDATPTLTGTAQADSTVTVYDNGTAIGTTTADGSGNWSYTPATALADGAQVFTATATDAGGNTSPISADYDVTVVPPAPSITAVSGDDAAVADGASTTDNTPTLAGTAQAGSTVMVYDNGVEVGTTTADAAGNWTFTPTTPVADGAQAFTATAADAGGNTSAASTPYDVTVLPVAPAAQVSDDGTTVTGTGIAGDTVTVYAPDGTTVLGTATVAGDGSYSVTLSSAQTDGQHLEVSQADPAGYVSPQTEATAPTIDSGTTAPDAPVIVDAQAGAGATATDIANGGSTNDATPTLTGTAEAGSTVTLSDNGTVLGTTTADGSGNWTFTPSAALADGAQVFTATATDAGNTSASSNTYDLTVDTTAPAAPVISDVLAGSGDVSNGDTTSDTTPTLTGTAEAGSTVTISDNGTVLGTTTANAAGVWDFTPSTALPTGMQDFTATASDAAGNLSGVSNAYDVTIGQIQANPDAASLDMGAVSEQVDAPVSASNVQVLGLLQSNQGTQDSLEVTVPANYSGDLTIQVSQQALLSVANAYDVVVTDAAGNVVYEAVPAGQNPLIGNVANLGVLGVSGSQGLTTTLTGLAPGNYYIHVMNDTSQLATLLGADGSGGISLEQLGQDGVLLGPQNQQIIINAIDNALVGTGLLSGLTDPLVTAVLNPLLTTTLGTLNGTPVTGLVDSLDNVLNSLGLTGVLDDVLGGVASALLSNTLTLLQQTTITATETRYTFSNLSQPVSGNVVTGAGDSNAGGADVTDTHAAVTAITNSSGTTDAVSSAGVTTINGQYGQLQIDSDGSYSYTAFGNPTSIGKSDVFTYTLSDGATASTATLTIGIEGSGFVNAVNDTAAAAVTYTSPTVNLLTDEGQATASVSALGGTVTLTPASPYDSPTFTIDANESVSGSITVSAGAGLLAQGTIQVEEQQGGNWTTVYTQSFSDTLPTGLIGLDSVASVDLSTLGLAPGAYRVEVSESPGAVLSTGQQITVDTDVNVTHLDQASITSAPAQAGNILSNDNPSPGPALAADAELQVLSGATSGSYETVAAGTPVTVHGEYGDLVLNSNGAYTYTPDTSLLPANFSSAPLTDTFDYQLVDSTTGEISQAQLAVSINPVGNVLGTAGSDDIVAGAVGGDTFTLKGGSSAADTLTFNNIPTHSDIWSDFNAANGDQIDISKLLSSTAQADITANPGNLGNYVQVSDTATPAGTPETNVTVDPTGHGNFSSTPLLTLNDVSLTLNDLQNHLITHH